MPSLISHRLLTAPTPLSASQSTSHTFDFARLSIPRFIRLTLQNTSHIFASHRRAYYPAVDHNQRDSVKYRQTPSGPHPSHPPSGFAFVTTPDKTFLLAGHGERLIERASASTSRISLQPSLCTLLFPGRSLPPPGRLVRILLLLKFAFERFKSWSGLD